MRKLWMLIPGVFLVVALAFISLRISNESATHRVKYEIAAPIAIQVYEDGHLSKIRVHRLDINMVRWYNDQPCWCVVHTLDGMGYAVDEPGQQTWDRFGKALKDNDENLLEFKIKGDGVDPHAPNSMTR